MLMLTLYSSKSTAQAGVKRALRAVQLDGHSGDMGSDTGGRLCRAAGQTARLRGALLALRPRREHQLLAQALSRPALVGRHHRPRAGHHLLRARLRVQLGRRECRVAALQPPHVPHGAADAAPVRQDLSEREAARSQGAARRQARDVQAHRRVEGHLDRQQRGASRGLLHQGLGVLSGHTQRAHLLRTRARQQVAHRQHIQEPKLPPARPGLVGGRRGQAQLAHQRVPHRQRRPPPPPLQSRHQSPLQQCLLL